MTRCFKHITFSISLIVLCCSCSVMGMRFGDAVDSMVGVNTTGHTVDFNIRERQQPDPSILSLYWNKQDNAVGYVVLISQVSPYEGFEELGSITTSGVNINNYNRNKTRWVRIGCNTIDSEGKKKATCSNPYTVAAQ